MIMNLTKMKHFYFGRVVPNGHTVVHNYMPKYVLKFSGNEYEWVIDIISVMHGRTNTRQCL